VHHLLQHGGETSELCAKCNRTDEPKFTVQVSNITLY